MIPREAFKKQLIVKGSTLEYYFTKLSALYKFDVVYRTQTFNDVLYLICNMCRLLYNKQLMFGKASDSSRKLILRWIKGGKLLHIRHAARYDSITQPEGVVNPIFSLLYHILKISYPESLYVWAYENQDYKLQMKKIKDSVMHYPNQLISYTSQKCYDMTVKVFRKLGAIASSAIVSMSEEEKVQLSQALSQVDAEPFLTSNENTIKDMLRRSIMDLPVVSSVATLIETIYSMFLRFYDGLKDVLRGIINNMGKITRSIVVVCGYVALFYFCCKIGQNLSRIAFDTLSRLFFRTENVKVDEYISQMSPKDGSEGEYECQFSFGTLSTGIIGLFGFLTFNTWDPKYVAELNSKIALAKNLSSIYQVIFENLVDIYKWCYSSITGKPFFQEDAVLQKFDELISEYYHITKEDDIANFIRNKPEACRRVMNLYKDMTEYDKKIRTMRSLTDMQKTRWNSMLNVARLWNNFCTRKSKEQITRVEPIWINISGKPGTGKSVIVDQLASYIMVRYNEELGKEKRQYTSADRYERKVQNEFWDGYSEQFLVSIDDLFQSKQIETRALQALELIHMCNNTAYPLHMSSVEEKSSVMFTSPLIISTTNDTDWNNLAIKDPEALYRRVTIYVEKIKIDGQRPLDATFYLYTKAGDKGKKAVDYLGQPLKITGFELAELAVEKMIEKSKATETFLKPMSPEAVDGVKITRRIKLGGYFDNFEPTIEESDDDYHLAEEDHDEHLEWKGPRVQAGIDHAADAYLAQILNDIDCKEMYSGNWSHASLSEVFEDYAFVSCEKLTGYPTLVAFATHELLANEYAVETDIPIGLPVPDNEEGKTIVTYAYVTKKNASFNLSTNRTEESEPMRIVIFTHSDKYRRIVANRDYGNYLWEPEEDVYFWDVNARYVLKNKANFGLDAPVDPSAFEFLTSYCYKVPCHINAQRTLDDKDLVIYTLFSMKTLVIVSTISISLLAGVALWRYFSAFDYDAQSIDKSHVAKNLKIARSKNFSAKSRLVNKYNDFKKDELRKIKTNRVKMDRPSVRKRNGEPTQKFMAPKTKAGKIAKEKLEKMQRKEREKQRQKERYRAHGYWSDGDEPYGLGCDENSYDSSDDEQEFYFEDYEMQMNSSLGFIANKCALNTQTAYVNYKGKMSIPCHLFFIKGSLACTASHYFSAYEQMFDSISLYAPNGSEGELYIPSERLQWRVMPDRDLIYINFPKEVPSYRNLTKFLKPFRADTVQANPARIEWSLYQTNKKVYNVRSFVAGAPSKAIDSENLKATMEIEGRKIAYINQRYYKIPKLEGYAGACGLPYMDFSDVATPLMGIHVAGLGEVSIVVPIISEDFADFNVQMSISDEVHPSIKVKLEGDMERGLIHISDHIPGVDNVCQLERKHYIASNSQIIPSMLMDAGIHEPTLFPAKLSGDPSPLDIAMSKYQGKPFGYHPSFDDLFDDRIFEGIIDPALINNHRQMLTVKQAIEGYSPLHIPSMDLSTGLGEPFTQHNITTKQLFDPDRKPTGKALEYDLKYHVDNLFLEELEAVTNEYENGDELPSYPVNDTLKDECRDKLRVDLHKTRLFDAGPKTHMLVKKRYLGHLVSDIEQGRLNSDILVGINVHSVEWTRVYEQLTALCEEDKEGFICGDFERWDKSLRLLFADHIAQYLAKLMHYDKRKSCVVHKIIRSAMLAVHFNPKGIYRVREGQTSGDYLTSIFNSIYNSVIHRLAFNWLCPDYKWQFNKYVRLFVYGDDSIASVHKEVRHLYNMKTLSKYFLNALGMVYTSPTKGDINSAFLKLSETSFLKRKFGKLFYGNSVYIVAQLDKESIHNSILYATKKKTLDEQWDALCNTCDMYLLEYIKYGENQFYAARRKITEAMKKLAKENCLKPYYFEDYTEMMMRYVLQAPEQ